MHALNHPFLKHMDTEMAKLARNLRQMHLDKAKTENQASASTSNAETADAGGNDEGFDASELL